LHVKGRELCRRTAPPYTRPVQLAAKKFIWIAAIVLPMLSGAHADQSRIVSIKEAQQYQNPTLLKQAWALPVAVLYQSGIEYQRRKVSVLRDLDLVGFREQMRHTK